MKMTINEQYELEHLVESWCDELAMKNTIACCVAIRNRGVHTGRRGRATIRLFDCGRTGKFDVYLNRAEFLKRNRNGTLREFVEQLIVSAIIAGEIGP